jgi:hypothetical protein
VGGALDHINHSILSVYSIQYTCSQFYFSVPFLLLFLINLGFLSVSKNILFHIVITYLTGSPKPDIIFPLKILILRAEERSDGANSRVTQPPHTGSQHGVCTRPKVPASPPGKVPPNFAKFVSIRSLFYVVDVSL